jgi:ADP-heptose:LPS heptosyltransferase
MRELGAHDIIFDLAATNRSMWLCQLNKAKLKVGFPYRTIHRLFYDIVVPRSDITFEVDDMLNMLKVFGHMPTNPHAYDLQGTPSRSVKPYILYFTTASTVTKCWPSERFIALINRMADVIPASGHLVLAGKEKWESTDEMKKHLGLRPNVSFINADTVDAMVGVIRGATIVISNDTSVRNIAIAAGVPSVGVFLSTALFRYLPLDGHHRIVYNRDGGLPTVDQVFECSISLLKELETLGKK